MAILYKFKGSGVPGTFYGIMETPPAQDIVLSKKSIVDKVSASQVKAFITEIEKKLKEPEESEEPKVKEPEEPKAKEPEEKKEKKALSDIIRKYSQMLNLPNKE
jgi:hypothetical protein